MNTTRSDDLSRQPQRNQAAPATRRADLIVVGSGAAGLSAALEASRCGARVFLVTGGAMLSGSSPRAQGGVAAAVGPDDDVDRHYTDTLAVGAGLNDDQSVRVLVGEGAQIAAKLLREGAPFAGAPDAPELGLEAGHSRRRILHAGGGASGWWLTSYLADRVRNEPRIMVLEHTTLLDLIVERGRVVGARFPDVEARADHTVLATGGAAALWGRTTNAPETRGVGIGLAWRAGATLADLEMIQFHPTALVLPGRPAFLLSEALRGEGALLVDAAERPFVDPLLPRDVVARAVAAHRAKHGDAYLSLRALDPDRVQTIFPALATKLAEWGLDLARDLLPVAPAAHYLMGGVRTDTDGWTGVPGLFVVGEAACTGAQGANRLASNSLLECLVFGRRAAHAAAKGRKDGTPAGGLSADAWPDWLCVAPLPDAVASNDCLPFAAQPGASTAALTCSPEEIGAILDRDIGVVRDEAGLLRAITELPVPNAGDAAMADVNVASLAARSAMIRRESRGAHFRADWSEPDPRWQGRILWRAGAPPAFEPIQPV